MYSEVAIKEIVDKQRKYFKTGVTLDIEFRKSQLKKLKKAMIDYEKDIIEALKSDLGRSDVEAFFCDIGTVILEINETLRGLKKWAKPEKLYSGLVCFPSLITRVYKMPYGVSLIISPYNFPFLLTFGVLIAAIAGGNTAVIKTSSKAINSTKVIKKIVADIYKPEYVTVIDGGHDVADKCLAQRFDKIFYTGSPRVGKHVLKCAAENLTPVALELGGENGNWCIIRKDADIRDAARKIAFFKLLNSGQVCININQVAVASEVADEFVNNLKNEFDRQIGDAVNNKDYPKLITKTAYDSCAKEALEYQDRIVYGGFGNEATLKYAPTIIYPVDIDENIVKHELFNPLLPIVVYEDQKVDELLKIIADREHGLALYIFTKDITWANKVMSTQQFGGGCINEVCLQLMVKGAPFNGTGHSGMGAYHGKWGFDEFTHPQTVLQGYNKFNLPLREHPYSGKIGKIKMKLLKLFER
ncbi:MAG TPA: aldehyde dehydrogenase family protein [Erysipelotrichaceae bacterium]|nr:aldehyde dehydrogenase family protein [Erysipelotrichaceae bacterium]HQA85337.1 aldehyde dehydrogenase family protein [Erysipelotrichaceae bacterium]